MLICIKRIFFKKIMSLDNDIKKVTQLHVTKTYLYTNSLTIGKVHVPEYVFDHENFHSEK